MQHMQRCVGVRVDVVLDGQRVFENAGMYDDGTVVPRSKIMFLLMISRTPGYLHSTYFFQLFYAISLRFLFSFWTNVLPKTLAKQPSHSHPMPTHMCAHTRTLSHTHSHSLHLDS